MRKLQSKLTSASGASMVLALVFLLLCTLVGSSVLVSATVNRSRLGSEAEQQRELTRRSAAHLLADELRMEDGELLQLHVTDTIETDSGTGDVRHSILFQITTNMDCLTPMQQLMTETAVRRYLQEHPAEDAEVTLQGFDWAQGLWDFRCQGTEGNLTLSGTATVSGREMTLLEETEVAFSCGAGNEVYDFLLEFPGMEVTVNAISGTGETIRYAAPPVTTEITRTVITWQTPKIGKGAGEE